MSVNAQHLQNGAIPYINQSIYSIEATTVTRGSVLILLRKSKKKKHAIMDPVCDICFRFT